MVATLLQWIEFFLLPPGIIFLFLLFALLFFKRSPMLSYFLTLSAFCLLLVFSMPLTARYLLLTLQVQPPLQMTSISRGKEDTAIVILGGGRYSSAPEYGFRDEISSITLQRLRYGADLAKKSGLPLMLSGGRRNSEATSEAVIMNQIMISVFDINTQFLEINSTNTFEQATEAKKILADRGIHQIYLVTSAWHMKRAETAFSAQGFKVIPAPMGFAATSKATNQLLPSAFALASSSRALHEYYALWYFKLFQQ